MKRLPYLLFFVLLTCVSMAQTPPVRLHVQASKAELACDGDDYTTIVITARDPEGEIITSMNGKVALRCSSGFLDETELQMRNGIAFTKFTAPIFGQPIKAAQRMVYFTVKFIRKFLSRFAGSTDESANTKLAQGIALETFKEINPLTLMPQKNGDNNVYFVAELNGIKGKTKVLIQKATEGGNSALLPGYYSGYDVTGQAHFELMLESGGKGQMTQGGTEAYSVLFTSEKSAEINSAMQKMMGGGEWMNAYMGASERDQQYMEGYDIKKNGLPSIYLPMPNNGIFLYVPPILLEYQGRPKETPSGVTAGTTQEVEKKPRVFVTIEQNELIGDGRTQTKAIFHYEDENKVPVAGKNFSWSIPKDIKVISSQTVTDASGNAVAVIQMPLLKATEEKRGDMWGQIIDNTALYRISVNFSTPKKQNESAYIDFSVYKTIEKNIRILKPGFEAKAVKVLLPQLEQYRLESSVYALVEMMNSPSIPDKATVNDAIVFIERKKFDEEYFNRNYEFYFKKDRKMFMTMLDDSKGGFMALTDANGNFKLDVGGNSSRVIKAEPIQAKLSDLTGKRKGSLAKALNNFKDVNFTLRMIDALFKMDKDLCSSPHQQAMFVEEKLHVLGNLMANLNSAAPMVKETSEAIIDGSWELVNSVAFFVNDKFKITEKLSEKTGLTAAQDKIQGYGAEKIKNFLNTYGGAEIQGTLKSKIYKELYKRIFSLSDKGKIKGVDYYYKGMGESVYNGMAKIFEDFLEKLSKALSDMITNNIADPKGNTIQSVVDGYYSNLQSYIATYMAADPQKVHAVYERLQPMVVDKSTEMRAMYADVGKKRMDMGYYKADKDLLADLSKAATVIGTVLVTRDYATMVETLDKIEKCSKALDGMMGAYNAYVEYGNYCALLSNVSFCFQLAVNSISAGTIVKPVAQQPPFISRLFPSAIAGESGDLRVPGLTTITAGSLKASPGNIPMNKLSALFDGNQQYESWLASQGPKIFSLADKEPAAVAAQMLHAVSYDNQLVEMAALSVSLAENPTDPVLINAWNKNIPALEGCISELVLSGSKVSGTLKTIPDNPAITLPDVPGTSKLAFFLGTRKYLIIGISSLVLLLLVAWILLRRNKRRAKRIQQSTIVDQPIIPTPSPVQVPSQPAQKPEPSASQAVSPKFCPQCGAPLVQGKKFCGKCGFKIQ